MALLQGTKKAFLKLFRAVCPGCGCSMPLNGSPLCPWCSLRLYSDGVRTAGDRQVLTAFHYRGIPRELILRLKFGHERKQAAVLAGLAVENWKDLPKKGDTIIPVPTTRRRIRERGYDQALLIAAGVSSLTGARVGKFLKRSSGDSQIGLSARERAMNIRGRFTPAGKPPARGGVWLLDDVMTTGSTIRECIGVLENAGFVQVKPLVVCFQKHEDESIIQGKEENHGRI